MDFDKEIVVSNANARNKDRKRYTQDMTQFFHEASRTLASGGLLAIIFNARDAESWQYFRSLDNRELNISYLGCFPMQYSANSVVQDNRKGALKYDYALIFGKNIDAANKDFYHRIKTINSWSAEFPAMHS